ncbi:hypothetical protein Pedsa_2932 [Pseudopedobacter saltans DSM 12145]|uniref:LiaF transmembrane domain-containing protein n=1 Tax=Pseudopedobacter saltans (strain ATCC 51119 / DSM 12145 / JCM 21818 / CCUG 39354 / LMG 10337 / NBRC 100064 / NCIMB 13643) TaxID=762903 RepID=F0S8Y4_PSESL|nr:DUF5668 domain-containing protein [Pseudopedobacter saltans]ADY53471.1 hypothetical protein Pedsa_2932 [Pseudopedobacter saltans DSM 12145]
MENQENDINYHKPYRSSGKIFFGFMLAAVGTLLLSKKFGYEYPDWLISWPMLLIVLGFGKIIKSGLSNLSWVPFMAIGGIFLAGKIDPTLDISNYILPVILISLGLFVMFGKSKNTEKCLRRRDRFKKKYRSKTSTGERVNDDTIESIAIFGEVKKTVYSQDFKGGEVITIMGGAQINLSQADIQDVVIIEAIQVFGGTKLIIPQNWQVVTEMAAIFGGIQDKRDFYASEPNTNKKIIIKGVSIFGGIDIKNY